MFCHSCGSMMHRTARACPRCGAPPAMRAELSRMDSEPGEPVIDSFTSATRSCFAKFATFRGRANRSEFWYFYLFYMCVVFAFDLLGYFSGAVLLRAAFSIFSLVMIMPLLSVSVRRVHDQDKSGAYILIGVFGSLISVIGIAISVYALAEKNSVTGSVGLFLVFIGGALSIWQFVLNCLPGTPGYNSYGAPTTWS